MNSEQLLLFLTGNADAPLGSFRAVIATNGVGRFIEAALRLEVTTERLKTIDKQANKDLRREVSGPRRLNRGGHTKFSRGGMCASRPLQE